MNIASHMRPTPSTSLTDRNNKDAALMAAAIGGDAAEVSRLLREDADACFQVHAQQVLMKSSCAHPVR